MRDNTQRWVPRFLHPQVPRTIRKTKGMTPVVNRMPDSVFEEQWFDIKKETDEEEKERDRANTQT